MSTYKESGSRMTSSRGKRADRIARGNEAAQMIYATLRALPKPSEAMSALCSVQAMMCILCGPHDLDEAKIRAMMKEMTNNVVRLIQGEQDDGRSDRDGGLSAEAPRRDN